MTTTEAISLTLCLSAFANVAVGQGDPCPGFPVDRYFVYKRINQHQSSLSELSDSQFEFQANMYVPTVDVVGGSFALGSAPAREMAPLFGPIFSFYQQFTNQQDLDTAYPGGPCQIEVRTDNSVHRGNLVLPKVWPPIPQLINWAEAQQINPGGPFVLRFPGVPAVDVPHSISVSISGFDPDDGETNFIYDIPSECDMETLAGATEVTIPANTLPANTEFLLDLTYTRGLPDTNAIPGFVGHVFLQRVTTAFIRTGASIPIKDVPPLGIRFGARGAVLDWPIGSLVVLESSDNLVDPRWRSLQVPYVTNNGKVSVEVPIGASESFFRLIAPAN